MNLKTRAFNDGGRIPSRYTCDGENISPPLEWDGVPGEARSLALICDDPDAPSKVWTHWVIFNIPPTSGGLDENVPGMGRLPDGSVQGYNDSGTIGYRGPCPPSGVHRYFFRLYALDTMLDLEPGAGKEDVLEAMEGHVLAEARIVGLYRRE
ncbi:YbhB/YbcL family Raf kinase inhibitor-like protein [Methanothermobacter sp. THM-2]|uniref:YbhB/YbcL family Raf kinase inhibitor-like protein n=1 Tax=Methanothermobacter sp. THM-2 TaxID=2606912 RepID=UPI001365E0A8|nr:YbhB/YbcL family Raf kinase inhibitor-like protein [Methanothermobacter sp. THM-2]QHN08716.1 YbhB/YbcL family Raf kinase inhibitor-like protein [Methanothermobacter sp. THM-2]